MTDDTTRRRLTRADLLAGTKRVEYVYFEELDGEIPLRPLTDGEFSRVEAIKASGGMTMTAKPQAVKGNRATVDASSMEINVDMEKLAEKGFEADCQAVAYSMADGAAWTVADVRQLSPPGIVAKIAAKVYEISGATPAGAKEAEFFRQNGGGADAAGADPDGTPAGADAE